MNQDINLVQNVGGEPRVSTLTISQESGNQHKNVLGLVRAYLGDLEDFGTVAFETRPLAGGGKPVQIAQLNEQQSTLLITYLRNTPVVVTLKKALVREFYAMKQALAAPAPTGKQLVALALIEAQGMLEAKDEQIAELEPKADAWDHIVSSEGSWSFDQAAKSLFEKKRIVTGEKRLVRQLIEWGYLSRDHKGRPRVYQRYVEQGLFKTRPRVYTDQVTGETRESSAPQVRITGKGLEAIYRRFTDGQLEVSA